MTVIAREHRVVLIRIPKTAPVDGDPAALYTATREWWRIAAPRTDRGPAAPTHALAVLKGHVVAAYAIDAWEQRDVDSRWRFTGRPATGDVAAYVDTDVSAYFTPGSQNPIRYVNCDGAAPAPLSLDRPATPAADTATAPGWSTSKHTQLWAQVADARERREAALAIAWLATQPGLHERARRGLLKELWWFLTEWSGKYGTRFRSLAGLEVQTTAPVGSWPRLLRHEHVVQRRVLSACLLAAERTPEAHWDVLRRAVACIVTTDEDKQLTAFDKTHEGWARYVAAGVAVVDMATGQVLTADDIAATLVADED